MAIRMIHSINAMQRPGVSKSSVKKLEGKIKKVRFSSPSVVLTDTEMQIAEEIIDPDSITVTFDDIGGLEEVKTALQELLILPVRRPELFAHRKLSTTPKGILLYGPPGTGKTLLAKATAKEYLNWSSILSKWLGESEKLATAVFTLARKLQPCIIFIDEIDSFLRNRSSYDNEANSHIKAQFMSMWDGLNASDDTKIVVIGATNRPDDIDEAIKRRMPRRFFVDLPGPTQPEEDVEYNFNYRHLADLTDKYSGSDLKELCRAAAYAPIRELVAHEKKQKHSSNRDKWGVQQGSSTITAGSSGRSLNMEDFISAMQSVRPSYESLNYNKNSGSRPLSVADIFAGMMTRQ